jgi:hypothetical protein
VVRFIKDPGVMIPRVLKSQPIPKVIERSERLIEENVFLMKDRADPNEGKRGFSFHIAVRFWLR